MPTSEQIQKLLALQNARQTGIAVVKRLLSDPNIHPTAAEAFTNMFTRDLPTAEELEEFINGLEIGARAAKNRRVIPGF